MERTVKEAFSYRKLKNNLVQCALCSQRCLIPLDKRGLCGVRENREGKLYTLVYELALAVAIDPIEKKPLFHFLPGTMTYSFCTAGCNFRCDFCQNWQESQASKGKTKKIPGYFLPKEEIINQALENNCPSISYTYTEPTVFFEYAYDTAVLAHQKGLKNIFVTNGYQTPETISMMKGVVDAANVDLKSFSDKTYQKICGAKLEPVLQSIKLMHTAGLWLEITTLIVPGLNDSRKELAQIVSFIASIDKNIPWHLSRFFPNYQMERVKPTPVETLEKAAEIGKKAGLKNVYLGNV